MANHDATADSPQSAPCYSLSNLHRLFPEARRLPAFGGPVALVGYMHRDLVEARGTGSREADYKEGLTLAQLMPGPLAAQLAIYLGYVHYGVLGATLVGVAFVLPVVPHGAGARLGLSSPTAACRGCRPCSTASAPSVIGIIAISAYKLTQKTIGKDWLLWAIYLVSCRRHDRHRSRKSCACSCSAASWSGW